MTKIQSSLESILEVAEDNLSACEIIAIVMKNDSGEVIATVGDTAK